MEYLLPSTTQKTKSPPLDIRFVVAVVHHLVKIIQSFAQTSVLMSADDKRTLTRHMLGFTSILNDVKKRSDLTEQVELVSTSSTDEKLRHFMHIEQDTLNGIVSGTLAVVEKLRINNRIHERQYQRVVKFYKAVIAMHTALFNKLLASAPRTRRFNA